MNATNVLNVRKNELNFSGHGRTELECGRNETESGRNVDRNMIASDKDSCSLLQNVNRDATE